MSLAGSFPSFGGKPMATTIPTGPGWPGTPMNVSFMNSAMATVGLGGTVQDLGSSVNSNKANSDVTHSFVVSHTGKEEKFFQKGLLSKTFCFIRSPATDRMGYDFSASGNQKGASSWLDHESAIQKIMTLSNMNQMLKSAEGRKKYGNDLDPSKILEDWTPMGVLRTETTQRSNELNYLTLSIGHATTMWNYWAASNRVLKPSDQLYLVLRRIPAPDPEFDGAKALPGSSSPSSSSGSRKRKHIDRTKMYDAIGMAATDLGNYLSIVLDDGGSGSSSDNDSDGDSDNDEKDAVSLQQYQWEFVPYCGPTLASCNLAVPVGKSTYKQVLGQALRIGSVVSVISSGISVRENPDYGRMNTIVNPPVSDNGYLNRLSNLPLIVVNMNLCKFV